MRTALQKLLPVPGLVAWLVIAFALCGLSGAAWATTAVVVDSIDDGLSPPVEPARLRIAVEQALQALQFKLIPASDVEVVLTGETQLKGCYSDLCFERLGRLVDSQLVVHYRIKALAPAGTKPGGLQLSVALFDGEVGAVGARLTEDCPGCTGSQAADQLSEMAKRAVLQNASLPRGVLEIYSTPTSATVFVDGTELGITPYKRAAFAGPHKLVLGHVGYRSQQIETVVRDNHPQRVEATLVSGTDPANMTTEREKIPVYKKWWFWVALGGAAVAASAITVGVVVGTRAAPVERMVPANTLTVSF